MPFVSKAQKGFLFDKKPGVAKEFAEHTPKGAKLPNKAGKEGKLAAMFKKGPRNA